MSPRKAVTKIEVGKRYLFREFTGLKKCKAAMMAFSQMGNTESWKKLRLEILMESIGKLSDFTMVDPKEDKDILVYDYGVLDERGYMKEVGGGTLNPEDLYEEAKEEKKVKSFIPTLSKVVLTPEQREEIEAGLAQYTNGKKLWEEWGLGKVIEKGRATSFLFHGPPGTGKTLVSQAIAADLGKE